MPLPFGVLGSNRTSNLAEPRSVRLFIFRAA
jgi:hypothetical protein